jgi:high-affinity iron transporter
MDFASALPTFVITLREGVEAALVVGIVLAYLTKSGQSHLRTWVYSGIGSGLAISGMVGVMLSWFVQHLGRSHEKYGPVFEPLLEGVFSMVAIGLLSWMLIWMTQNAKGLKASVEGAIGNALTQGRAGLGIFALVFFAVLREGFETVLFIASKFQQGLMPAIGALLGMLAAVVIGVMFFRLGMRLNLRKFFLVMGILLLFIVAGLVIAALGHFDTAVNTLAGLDRKSADLCFWAERFAKPMNRSCILGPMVWNLTAVLPDDKFPGIFLSALFGYTQRLFTIQAVGYVAFLVTIGSLYLTSLGFPLPQWLSRAKSIVRSN